MPVAVWQLGCEHFAAMYQQVIAGENWHFWPVAKVKLIVAVKQAIEALRVERHFAPGKASKLLHLVGLLLKKLILWKILAFHQEREDLVLEILGHG